jgi:hypothetical protein
MARPRKYPFLIEDCRRIDVQDLIRTELNGSGFQAFHLDQLPSAAFISSGDGSFLEVAGRRFALIRSAIPQGRWRWFVQCPATGRRCAALFITPQGQVGTRHLLRLTYRCARVPLSKRASHRRWRAFERLQGPTDQDWVEAHPEVTPRRPKRRWADGRVIGMRWRTYRKIVARLDQNGDKGRIF